MVTLKELHSYYRLTEPMSLFSSDKCSRFSKMMDEKVAKPTFHFCHIHITIRQRPINYQQIYRYSYISYRTRKSRIVGRGSHKPYLFTTLQISMEVEKNLSLNRVYFVQLKYPPVTRETVSDVGVNSSRPDFAERIKFGYGIVRLIYIP